jgi:hypothetical protein
MFEEKELAWQQAQILSNHVKKPSCVFFFISCIYLVLVITQHHYCYICTHLQEILISFSNIFQPTNQESIEIFFAHGIYEAYKEIEPHSFEICN